MTIKDTDTDTEPTTPALDDADLVAEAEAETETEEDAEAQSVVDDEVDDVDPDDETESEVTTDGRPEDNGEDPEALDPQDDDEVLETSADEATDGRPFLSDDGIFEERWNAIQIGFVDDPRSAVESADHLVTEAIDDLAKILASHRELLQAQWHQDGDVDTEQLRVVFRDYRTLLLGLLHT